MGVRDVAGRTQIAVEFLHAREGEGIVDRREPGHRKILSDKSEDGGRLGDDALFGDECRYAAFRIDGQIFGRLLLLLGEVDPHRFERGAGVDQSDVGRQRAGAGRVIQLEHTVLPMVFQRLRSGQSVNWPANKTAQTMTGCSASLGP